MCKLYNDATVVADTPQVGLIFECRRLHGLESVALELPLPVMSQHIGSNFTSQNIEMLQTIEVVATQHEKSTI